MIIIPAIDILGGKCVRLTRGDFSLQKVYDADPLSVAKNFEREGARMLHVVDLDGAKTGKRANEEVITSICKALSIPVEIGGGIRDENAARTYLEAGAARVIIGTSALGDPETVPALLREFGRERIVVAVEVKGGKIASRGWQETSDKPYQEFAQELKKMGVTNILFTDVERDGTLTKPNFEIAKELVGMGFNVIASGGVSDVEAIQQLKKIGVTSAIVGKAIYEGKLPLEDAMAASKPVSNLTKRIIPCLDVTGGKVVKGVEFKKLQVVGDPVELGKKYSDDGADELVFLDIGATKDERDTLYEVIAAVAKNVFIPFTVGGGISSINQIRKILHLGADKVSLNTAAVKNPELISEAAKAFGQQCVVVAIDAKKKGDSWKVFLKGGTEETPLDVVEWAREAERRGAGEILLTSMDKDGTKSGYDIALLRRVTSAVNIPVIASGGAGSLEDMKKGIEEGNADAVLVASLFHFGEYSVKDAKEYLAKEGIPMRI